jgi:hypothetical protein
MLRAERRRRQAIFLGRHRRVVEHWARRDGGWSEETIARVARRSATVHGTCCKAHQAWPFRRRYVRPPPGTTDWAQEGDGPAGEPWSFASLAPR